MKSLHRFAAAPALALLLLAVLPLALGFKTLFLRDAFGVHLPWKAEQAKAMAAGSLPLVAAAQAGGQPLLGNPNAVPFYPDNLLYLAGGVLWAFNAHFWLHLLAAPWAAYALGRAWGLSRRASWAAGLAYGASGFAFSHLDFYNLVAGMALAPALAAAALRLAEGKRDRLWAPACGGLWALLLLAGDPFTAALAGALALGTVLARGLPSLPDRRTLVRGGLAALCGTLAAAPQILEMWRILPGSYRGLRGYSAETASLASFDPRQALEWLLPMAFGRPDVLGDGRFWGHAFYTGLPPFYLTLYPGLAVLALVAVSGLRDAREDGFARARLWAWLAAGGGLFFALGRFNPLAEGLLGLAGGAMRYPVKVWLGVALGGALLAGIGFERAFVRRAPRAVAALGWVLSLGAGAFLLAGLGLRLVPASVGILETLVPERYGPAFADAERLRWGALALVSALVLALARLLLALAEKRPRASAAGLLLLHTASQLLLLAPAWPTDAAAPYRQPPPLLAHVPEGARLVQGTVGETFSRFRPERGAFPEPEAFWVQRRLFAELHPAAGVLHGRRYELDLSPEGLGSFLSRAARDAVRQLDDRRRLRLLAAWGVTHLVLDRSLEADPGQARLLAREPSFGGEVRIYEILEATPEVYFTPRVLSAPHLNAALARLLAPEFDPRTAAVLAGQGPPRGSDGGAGSEGGRVENVRIAAEEMEAEVHAAAPGAVVWQRAHLPLYRASIDGEEVPVAVANLHRMAVEVPGGTHRLRIWADRRPLATGAALCLLGLGGLVGLGLWRSEELQDISRTRR